MSSMCASGGRPRLMSILRLGGGAPKENVAVGAIGAGAVLSAALCEAPETADGTLGALACRESRLQANSATQRSIASAIRLRTLDGARPRSCGMTGHRTAPDRGDVRCDVTVTWGGGTIASVSGWRAEMERYDCPSFHTKS